MWANEIDPYCADWLRNLFPGITVDERSIVELRGSDVIGERAHFFAGIGGWEYALRLAGWPEDRPVWTGSCPCQPLSSAGRRKGHADERHVWPAFYSLIAECRPATIFGEQVASNLGREWLSGVRADLEGLGYAVGAADLCAAGVGAPHIRQRLFWVADSERDSRGARRTSGQPRESAGAEATGAYAESGRCGDSGGMDDPDGERREGFGVQLRTGQSRPAMPETGRRGEAGPWSDAVWIDCLDGKARRIKSGSFEMVDGLSAHPSFAGSLIGTIAQEIANYAKATESRPREVLSALQLEIGAQAIRASARRSERLPAPSILLSTLCELAGKLGHLEDRASSRIPETQESSLRGVWSRASESRTPPRSSQGRKLSQQRSGELRDPMHLVSLVLTTLATATSGSPLAHGIPARASKLRAYGNAIVPSLAAKFIEAFLKMMENT